MQLASTPSPSIPHPPTEPRAVVALGPDEGERVWFVNHLVIVKLRGPDAPYGVIEVELDADNGTPFHRHTDEDEAFYVLRGELSIFLEGGRVVRAVPGSYVHIPRGVAHGFRTHTHARILALCNPMGFVDLTREYGVPAPRVEPPPAGPPDLPRLDALAKKYHIDILGPLPE